MFVVMLAAGESKAGLNSELGSLDSKSNSLPALSASFASARSSNSSKSSKAFLAGARAEACAGVISVKLLIGQLIVS